MNIHVLLTDYSYVLFAGVAMCQSAANMAGMRTSGTQSFDFFCDFFDYLVRFDISFDNFHVTPSPMLMVNLNEPALHKH
jgi:hypothetical protein